MNRGQSDVFRITDCPIPTGGNKRHEGIDALLSLRGQYGLKLHRTSEETGMGSEEGLLDGSDVVLIKVKAQWKHKGCTNSGVIRGLAQRTLRHPDGFDGEIALYENEQGGDSLDCDRTGSGRYLDTSVHANAEYENPSVSYLVDAVFADPRISKYLLGPIWQPFISKEDVAN